MKKLTIVKVGGAVVEDEFQLGCLIDDFCRIEGLKMLVHGGGRRATKIAAALGIESKMVDGRRITDKDMLEVVTMVYGGLINKNIVSRLQSHGVNAAGLTGADMNVIRSRRRPVRNGIDFGFVGDVESVDSDILHALIEQGVTPVMAPLTHDCRGCMLNTNADTIASATAMALARHYEVTLIYCFEKNGVLADPDDDNSVIPTITRADYERYVTDGIISGGMMPKIENALDAVDAGVDSVIITKATAIGCSEGTKISR